MILLLSSVILLNLSLYYVFLFFRLENALSEIAWNFYQSEAKGVRAHRDFLNKTNHTLLFVRHQFKLGLLSEMRNDAQSAIK